MDEVMDYRIKTMVIPWLLTSHLALMLIYYQNRENKTNEWHTKNRKRKAWKYKTKHPRRLRKQVHVNTNVAPFSQLCLMEWGYVIIKHLQVSAVLLSTIMAAYSGNKKDNYPRNIHSGNQLSKADILNNK